MDLALFEGTNFLIIVDTFSKFPWSFALKSTTSLAIIGILSELFATFGNFKTIVTDNGPQFASEELGMYFKKRGIKHLFSPAYHPSSNGAAERMVRTFKECMKKLVDSGLSLRNARLLFLEDYRTTSHPTTGHSPYNLMFKREAQMDIEGIKLDLGNEPKDPVDKIPIPTHKKSKHFSPDDPVWVKENDNWIAAKIISNEGEVIYIVEKEVGGEKRVHVDQLKPRRIMPSR
jgi:hypothetical protein